MNLVLVICLLSLATFCAAQNRPAPRPVTYPEDDNSINAHFRRFKLRHGKKYRNTAHEAYKKTLFKEKVQAINRHNRLFQQGRRKYTMDVNFFTDLEEHELKNYNGFIGKRIKKRSVSFPQSLVQNSTLLPLFDWRSSSKVAPIKNQGVCSNGWIFAGVSTLESQYSIKYNTPVQSLSEQNVVDCADKAGPYSVGTCSPAGSPNWVWDFATSQNGLYLGSDYPYTGTHLGQCANKTVYNPSKSVITVNEVDVPNDETLIAKTISSLGPVTVGIIVCPNFYSYSGGVFDDPACLNKPLSHAVALVGYGTFNGSDYFILRNSWGSNWGQNGYMFIARNKGMCNLASSVMIPQLSDSSSNGQTNTVFYTAMSPDTIIRNPERGLANHDYDYQNLNKTHNSLEPAKLQLLKSNFSLVYILFYLNNIITVPIPQNILNDVNNQFTILRNAGFKAVVRFGYNSNATDYGNIDPTRDMVLQHIAQLKPILLQNSDVIFVMQAGFIGQFGEWHNSDNFGNSNDRTKLPPASLADRKAVLDAVLDALPPTRMAQIRYPVLKRMLYNQSGPIADSDAYSGTNVARIGHHNQCFLASADDAGTYYNFAVDVPYLIQETKYLPMGGETCGVNQPRTDCPTALNETALFHWSYLDISTDIAPELSNWMTQGCFRTIQNRLGYRFQLVSSVFPSSAKTNTQLQVQISLNNTGFAAPFNPRIVYLVLKSSTAQYSLALKSNPNYWLPGSIIINESVNLTSVNPGTYKLYLNLPDPAPTLSSIVDYSIQMANIGTWDSTTGLNDLMQTINITN